LNCRFERHIPAGLAMLARAAGHLPGVPALKNLLR